MVECWQEAPNRRPSFVEVANKLRSWEGSNLSVHRSLKGSAIGGDTHSSGKMISMLANQSGHGCNGKMGAILICTCTVDLVRINCHFIHLYPPLPFIHLINCLLVKSSLVYWIPSIHDFMRQSIYLISNRRNLIFSNNFIVLQISHACFYFDYKKRRCPNIKSSLMGLMNIWLVIFTS